jgi:solute carrier family 12 sodium/potassium/chloride transporter 2
VIPDITKKANPETKAEFEQIVSKYPKGSIEASEISANAERTNRHLRTAELLREKSANSELIVLTLPLPRIGGSSALYMAWLEMMTKGLPPVLLTRGNQSSVLTFYS